MTDRTASQPRSICDRTTWPVLLNDEVMRMVQASLYSYYRPAVGVLDSKGPLSCTIAPSILTEVNEEVKLVATGCPARLPLARRKGKVCMNHISPSYPRRRYEEPSAAALMEFEQLASSSIWKHMAEMYGKPTRSYVHAYVWTRDYKIWLGLARAAPLVRSGGSHKN